MDRAPPALVVVMGVSGAGKTTFGSALAAALNVSFQEGDALHPAANVAKMRRGLPLDDEDRAPWLDRVADWLTVHARSGGVVSCSALKRSYRDRLRRADREVRFAFLNVERRALRHRLAARADHFMPGSLLDSQLDTLEPPDREPDVLVLDGTAAVEPNLAITRSWLASLIDRDGRRPGGTAYAC